jgi:hypothetical protein
LHIVTYTGIGFLQCVEDCLLSCSLFCSLSGLNTGQYWVDGYNERNNVDEWKFSDDTLVPMDKHFWKEHAPNEKEGDPFCIRMVRHSGDEIGDHRFDDTKCSKTFGYICEQN